MSQENTTQTEQSNRPSHRVTYRPKLKNGYGNTVRLGGAWVNSAGGISFPAYGGQVTIWSVTENEDDAS